MKVSQLVQELTMPQDRAMEMARKFVRESNECEVMDTYQAHEDTYVAGFGAGRLAGKQKGSAEAFEEAALILDQRLLMFRNWEPWQLKPAIEDLAQQIRALIDGVG